MSEQRLERIEAQIAELRDIVMSTRQDLTVMQQNLNAIRADINALRQRSDMIESTVVVNMRQGFTSLRNYLDDLTNKERKQAQLNRSTTLRERRQEED